MLVTINGDCTWNMQLSKGTGDMKGEQGKHRVD